MSSFAALRKLGELAQTDRRAALKYKTLLADFAPWEHAAGSYGSDAVTYPMRRAAWRLLKLSGVLGDAL